MLLHGCAEHVASACQPGERHICLSSALSQVAISAVQGARDRLQALGLNVRASVPSLRLAIAAEAAAEAAIAGAAAPASAAKRL